MTQIISNPDLTPYGAGKVPLIGIGTANGLGGRLKSQLGRVGHCFLVVDPGLLHLDEYDQMCLALREAGHKITPWHGFASNPKASDIDAGLALARELSPDLILGVGGGSALDVAKLVAGLATSDGPSIAFAEMARAFPDARPLLWLLPTTAGTGSEATAVAVFSDDQGQKRWAWGESLKADLVVLDASFTRALPPALTTATALDALVHAMEAATNRKTSDAARQAAARALGPIAKTLPVVMASPGDLLAREVLLRGAYEAGVAIDLAGTAIAHAIGHALASLMPIHHGKAVALGMAASLPWLVGEVSDGFAWVAGQTGWGRKPGDVLEGFQRLAGQCNLPLGLSAKDADMIPPARLAASMQSPQNSPMVAATARDASEADLLHLARTVLTYRDPSPQTA